MAKQSSQTKNETLCRSKKLAHIATIPSICGNHLDPVVSKYWKRLLLNYCVKKPMSSPSLFFTCWQKQFNLDPTNCAYRTQSIWRCFLRQNSTWWSGQNNCPDKIIVRTIFFVQGIWIHIYFMSSLLYTKLAYDSSDIKDWMSCSCIVHTLECFIVCFRCSWCLSTPLLFAEKSHLLDSNVFKVPRCFLSMWLFMFLVHLLSQYLLYWEGVITYIAVKIWLGDKTIMFSVHMRSKKAFLSKSKLSLFTL